MTGFVNGQGLSSTTMFEMCTKAMFINKLNNVFGGNTRDVLYVNLKINRTNKNKSLF